MKPFLFLQEKRRNSTNQKKDKEFYRIKYRLSNFVFKFEDSLKNLNNEKNTIIFFITFFNIICPKKS